MRYYKALAEISLMALALASCAKEQQSEALVVLSGQELTITATIGDPETRTERASDGAVLWSPGDQISLFYGSGTAGGSCFTAQNAETAKVANFTGTIGVITGGNDVSVEDTYFWATYPYNATASCDGTSVTTVLPSEQVATPDTFADDLFPSIGRSQGLNMAFYNICGGLKFTVSEEGIRSVTLQGNNGEILAGTLTVAFDDTARPVVQNIGEGSEIITVSAPVGETFEVGRAYYIVLVPTVFEKGFTLTFKNADCEAVYNREKATTIKRSGFGTLTTPDKDLVWQTSAYVNIPDENFRAYMVQNFDTNGNGRLDFEEAEAVKEISVRVNDLNIKSLQGIEYCTNLERLYCNGSVIDGVPTGLSSLDVSHNTCLTYLYCGRNPLTELNLSNNTGLSELWCHYTNISSLDLSNNISLQNVYCNNNKLETFELGQNNVIVHLNCAENRIQSLNLAGLTSLNKLYCASNQLTSLIVSSCSALDYLSCSNNNLTSLDVSANTALSGISCSSNQLTSLDVSTNTALASLYCQSNQLTVLDVSDNPNLTSLNCTSNPDLTVVWLKSGQFIESFNYDADVTTIRYKGSSGAPMVINTADELIAFLGNPNCDVELGSDIDLSGRSLPIVDNYSGTFNGLGHTIKGLESSSPMFSTLSGVVSDITFDSSCAFAPSVPVFGIVAGTNNGSITKVINKASVNYSAESITEPVLIAAIAGISSGGISDCVNEGPVSLASNGGVVGLGVAGIVAYQSSTLYNCVNRGPVSFSAPYISEKATVVDAMGALPGVGGVSAIGAPGFSMQKCDNYGKVSYNLYAAETDLTVSMSRNQIGGVVSSPCGEVRNCNNYGEVNVSLKHSVPGTELPFEFIACVGGIGGGDYLFTGSNSTENKAFNTEYINCLNEGTIIVDSDASLSNTAVGGIVGWPGQEKAYAGSINNCINKGNIIGRGVMKCRLGGVSGGTGQMYKCTNEGTVTLESGSVASALGSLCGFHSQNQYILNCVAKGEVICNVPDVTGGISGFIGNLGNAANQTATGCSIDCKITVATYDPNTVGMIVGKFNGTSRPIVLGEDSPIQVSGSINGTPASDSNIYGLMNDSNHTIYYVIK